MKFKTKKIGILLIIGLILPVVLAYSFNSFNDYIKDETTPKVSAGYIESFIHIDGSIPSNWSATEGEPWCNLVNGVYIIENVTIDASSSPTGSGILINNSKNVKFLIRNCTIFNADKVYHDSGIWLENTNNGTIRNNNCSDNNLGIYLIDCEGNNITENTVNNNENNGIYLDTDCNNNNITGNTANENNHFGIQLSINCDYNNLTLNTANNNGEYGIFINSAFNSPCDNNIILNNTANENNYYGIYIRYTNYENSIINNTANNNNRIGIHMQSSYEFNITGNTINNNTRGVELQGCDNSNIMNNTIKSNLEIGINLQNSDSNEIKNNTINRNDLGIALYQSDYNNITGNDLKYNNWCIYETSCVGNIIDYNDCSSPTVEFPIFINGTATGVGAHNWTWAESQTWCSGTGESWDPYIIENLKISGFGIINYGIDIRNSYVSFIIRECLIYNSYQAGIYLNNVNNSRLINNNCSNNRNGIYAEFSNKITIFENTANGNINDGIYLEEINYVNITGNTVNNNNANGIVINICNFSYIIENIVNGNSEKGIFLEECFNNTISGNNVNNNEYGIYLWTYCFNNTLSGNYLNGNQDGIYLEESDYNSIIENIANDNDRIGIILSRSDHNYISENFANGNIDNGIYLEDECYYNIISGNYFNGNQDGIILSYSDFNYVIGNTANNNDELGIGLEESNNNTISGNTVDNSKNTGVCIQDDSHENDIIGNIIYNNTQGIYFESNCGSNLVYKNFFLKNGKHAVDDGSDNKWNNTIIGNYWDNHTGPDVSPQDGIVDNPYTYIGGSAGSIDYLPIAEDGAPRIIINSPLEGERFVNTAPNFNIEVTDIYVYEMWYTLDGGLSNYSFTENGMIDQSAWDALADGSITLKFYARDIVGNLGSAEVDIIKRTSSPGGLDPGVVVIIVVLSVLGGLAIIGAILGILLKTGKISREKLKSFSLRKN